MLTTLIIIPILGSISLLCLDSGQSNNLSPQGTVNVKSGYDLKLRQLALFWSVLAWLLSVIIWMAFDYNLGGVSAQQSWQFVNTWLSFTGAAGGSLRLGIDAIGLIFILLTTYLIPVSILCTWDTTQYDIRNQLICILLLESMLIVVFASLDIIAFYVSFESVLIPLYIIVGAYGATKSRLRASMLLFMYTLFGSLFMLLGLIQLLELTGTTDMTILSSLIINSESQRWIWLCIFISLAAKAPLVPLNIWLPRAHSESSLAGSVLLAGIVLKLSVYGYLRLLLPILPDASIYFRPLVLTLGIISIIHGSLVTLRQVDTKVFIAYSSVAHMGVVFVGLASGTIHGIQGAILLSVAHGLISPALFIIVGGIYYDRLHTRTIRYIRGTGSYMPSLKFWFWLASVASMSVPGSLNWVSELLCLAGAYEISPFAAIMACSSVILGAVYTVWFYVNLTGGSPSPNIALTPDLTRRERTLLMMLIIPTFILGIYPSFLLNLLNTPFPLLA